MHACIHTYIHTYTHSDVKDPKEAAKRFSVFMYTYIHTYIHTHSDVKDPKEAAKRFSGGRPLSESFGTVLGELKKAVGKETR
jgi:hypothetical protein